MTEQESRGVVGPLGGRRVGRCHALPDATNRGRLQDIEGILARLRSDPRGDSSQS